MAEISGSAHFPQLAQLGWSAEFAATFQPYAADHRPARITRVDRGGADLIGTAGPDRATFGGDVLAGAAHERSRLPAVGDWVALRDWPDGRVTIEAVLPRRTSVVRDGVDRTSQGQVVAANVDVVVIVEHLEPEPDLRRIERLLVLAWGSGAEPVVVLTKADLVPDPEGMAEEAAAVAPGVEVILVSATTGQGVDAVRAHLGVGVTMVMLGPSGAGKSTLTNLLAGEELMATGEVRAVDGKGRHTTTHRELVTVPGLGVLLDTPGLRAVGLVGDADAVASAFPEVDALTAECRFRDCSHTVEPGCAVLAAVEDGSLDESRLASWQKLGREAAFHARRADARLRAEEAAISRKRAKHLRLIYKGNSG